MDAPAPSAARVAVVSGGSSGIGRAVGEAFGALGWGVALGARGEASFYEDVHISFRVVDAAEHYHVPLLLSPFGYSTYRGS